MNLLLDTYVFLWFVIHSPRLSKAMYQQIETAPEVYISTASLWEVAIRSLRPWSTPARY